MRALLVVAVGALGCATVPEVQQTMAAIDEAKNDRAQFKGPAPASAALRDHYCPTKVELRGDEALACADFLEKSRDTLGAEALWVSVAAKGPEQRQQCLAVHRLKFRGSEAAQRQLSPQVVTECDALVAATSSKCEARCRQDVPACLALQQQRAAALNLETFVRHLVIDAPLYFYDAYEPKGPPVPQCEQEFRTCFRGCMMPR